MSTVDQDLITVSVEGEGSLGVFDTWDGGDGDSSETKYREGGSGDEVTLGGNKTLSNVTVSRLYKPARDAALFRRVFAKRGQARATASRQPLDSGRLPYGDPLVANGIVKKCMLTKADSNATGPKIWTMEISTEGDLG
jgi:hypothetical protein